MEPFRQKKGSSMASWSTFIFKSVYKTIEHTSLLQRCLATTARSSRPLCSYWEWRLPPDASHMWSGLIKPFPPSLAGQLWFMLSNSRPRPQSLLTLHPVLFLPFSHLAPLFTSPLISYVLFVFLSCRFSLQKYFPWLLKNGICVDAAGSQRYGRV